MGPLARNNVTIGGSAAGRPMMFAHGFGCDQNMWRFVEPAFARQCRTILFDHVGAGLSDLSAYDTAKYATLHGYAADVVEIVDELDLRDVTLVGHSVSAMICALAVQQRPERFARLVMVGPSARYLNDVGYVGGFEEDDIAEMLAALDANYLEWSSHMAPAIVGHPDRPELGRELTESFCRTDPAIAHQFATVTFTSDNRADMANLAIPTLIVQCKDDFVAPTSAGEFIHNEVPGSVYRLLDVAGHCPNLSHPVETIEAIQSFISD